MNKVKVSVKIPSRNGVRPVTAATRGLPVGTNISLAEKRAQAMEYRRDGHSYKDIAILMNTTVSTVYAWIMAELRALRTLTIEEAEDVRDMELQRLDKMLNSLQVGILAGDPASIGTALRVGERRARLLGLDAATKIDAKGAIMNLTPEAVAQMSNADIQKTLRNLVTLAGQQKMIVEAVELEAETQEQEQEPEPEVEE